MDVPKQNGSSRSRSLEGGVEIRGTDIGMRTGGGGVVVVPTGATASSSSYRYHGTVVANTTTNAVVDSNLNQDATNTENLSNNDIHDNEDDDIQLAAVVPESPPSPTAVPTTNDQTGAPSSKVVDGSVVGKTNSFNTRFANSASTSTPSSTPHSTPNGRRTSILDQLVIRPAGGDDDDEDQGPGTATLPFHPDTDVMPNAASTTLAGERSETVIVDSNHFQTHEVVSEVGGSAPSSPPQSPAPNVEVPKKPIFAVSLPGPSTSSSSALNTPSDKCSPSSIGGTSSSSSFRFDQRRRNSSVLLPMQRGPASGGVGGGGNSSSSSRNRHNHQSSSRQFHHQSTDAILGRRSGATSGATPEEEEEYNDNGGEGEEDPTAADDVGRYYEREYGVPNDDLVPQRKAGYVGDDPQLDALFSTISEHAAPQSASSNRGGALMVVTSSTTGSGSGRRGSVATPNRMASAGSPRDSFNFGQNQQPSNHRRALSGSGSPTLGQLRGGIPHATVNVPSNFERALSASPPLSAAGIPSPAATPSPSDASLSASSSPRLPQPVVAIHELRLCQQAGLSDVVARTHLMGAPQQQQHPSGDFDRSTSGTTSPTTGGITRIHVSSISGGGANSSLNIRSPSTSSSRVHRGPESARNHHPSGGGGSPNFTTTSSTRRIRRASSAVPPTTRVEEVYSHTDHNTYTVATEPRRGGGGGMMIDDGGSTVESVGGTTDPGSITRVYYKKGPNNNNNHSHYNATSNSHKSRRNTTTTLHTVGGDSAFSTNVHTTFDSSPNEHSVIHPDSYGAVVIDPLSEGDSGQSFGSEGWVRRELQRAARSEDRRVAFLKSPAPLRCLLFSIWAIFTRIGSILRAIFCCCGSKFKKCCFVSYKEKFMPHEVVSAEELHHQRSRDTETMPQCCCIFALRCTCCCGDVVYEPNIFERPPPGDHHHHHNRVLNDDEGDLDADDNVSNDQGRGGGGGGGDPHWRTHPMCDDSNNHMDRGGMRRGSRGRGGKLNGVDRIHYTRQQQLRARGAGTTPRQFRPFQHHHSGVPTQDGLGSFVDDEDDEELLEIDVLGRHFAPSDSFAAFRGGDSSGSGGKLAPTSGGGDSSLSPNGYNGGRESSEGFPLDDRSTPIGGYDVVGSGDTKTFHFRSPTTGFISHNNNINSSHTNRAVGRKRNQNSNHNTGGTEGSSSPNQLAAKPATSNSNSTSESDSSYSGGMAIGDPIASVHELVMPLNHRESEKLPPQLRSTETTSDLQRPLVDPAFDEFGITPLGDRRIASGSTDDLQHDDERSTPIQVGNLAKVSYLATSFTPTADSDISDTQHHDTPLLPPQAAHEKLESGDDNSKTLDNHTGGVAGVNETSSQVEDGDQHPHMPPPSP